LNLQYDEALSKFAFNLNLRRYFTGDDLAELHLLMRADAWAQCEGGGVSGGAAAGAGAGDVRGDASAGVGDGDGDGTVDASAEFYCGTLPACAPTCAGPVRRVLAPLAHTSGCAAEGLAHAAALRAVLVLTVFVAANAARDAAVRGAAAISW